jgi:hypothetical protein
VERDLAKYLESGAAGALLFAALLFCHLHFSLEFGFREFEAPR